MDIKTTSPVKLFEYAACKIPIIVSNIPAVAKITENRKHALMPEPDNIKEIKENIISLLGNTDLQNKCVKLH
jgi:glycosyltransferase involved in cell wall biosynthesis